MAASPELVGRRGELQALLDGLSSLGSGRGSLFLISGEPGIGKTRLADELCGMARAVGASVAWGAAWDGGGAPSYWPWIQALRDLRSRLPPVDDRLRADLGPLWDGATSSRGDEHDVDAEVLRFRRFDALRSVLQTAAARGPLVIVLDDLHAADRASLLALQFIARSLRTLPVLLIGTHRDAEARLAPELADLFDRISREATVLHLGRLARDDVARLMADLDSVPDRVIDAVFETTGGNPLFVGETVRLVRTGARLDRTPASVDAVIRDRLALFDVRARALLEAAAVIGREVAWATLAEACGTTVDEARATLKTAKVAGVVEDAGSEGFRFSHALFRERLRDDLPRDVRNRLELATAETLARRLESGQPAMLESIARHFLAALPSGDASRAADWAVRAGRAAMLSLAFDRAAELLEGALAILDASADGGRRTDVELQLAEALARCGHADRGRTLCLAAVERARAAGDGERLARAALIYGAQLRVGLVDPRLVALLEEALAALAGGDPRLRATVMARLAAAEQPARDPQKPVQRAREAIALARETGDADTLLTVLHTAGSALVDYAPVVERVPLARELVSMALPRGDLVLAQRGYLRALVDHLELGDVTGADAAAAAYVRLGEALGHARWQWRGALARSMRALMEGRWTDSDRARARAAALAEQADDPSAAVSLAMHHIGALRARESCAPADLASEWDMALDSTEYSSFVAPLMRAAVLVRAGEIEPARHALAAMPLDDLRVVSDPMIVGMLAELIAATRDRAWAARLLSHLEPDAERTLTWGVMPLVWEGPISQWIGALHAVLERWDDAASAFEDALAAIEGTELRPLRARLRHELGAVLLSRGGPGDVAQARSLLDAARTDAVALGMTHLVARVDATGATTRATTPVAAPPAQREVTASFSIAREGEVWSLESGGRIARLKHSRGLEILEMLVNNPGREIHVLDLAAAEPGEVIDLGDAGEALDPSAKSAYRKRIADLEEDLREAESWADTGRRDRLRAELEFLREELARGVGLGGRDRRSGAAVERARVNVQKRLRGVVRKIAETLPDLGRHLETELKTGIYVSYRHAR